MAATKCCFNLEWNIKTQELENFFSCQPSQRIVSRPYTFNMNINGSNDQITFFLMAYPKGINKIPQYQQHQLMNNNNHNNNMNNNNNNNNKKRIEIDYNTHIGLHLSDIPLFIHQIRSTVKFKLPQIQNYGHFDSVIFDLYNNGDYFSPLGFMSFNKLKSLITSQKTNKCIVIQCELQILRMSTMNQQSVSFTNAINHNVNNNNHNNNNDNNMNMNLMNMVNMIEANMNNKSNNYNNVNNVNNHNMNLMNMVNMLNTNINANLNPNLNTNNNNNNNSNNNNRHKTHPTINNDKASLYERVSSIELEIQELNQKCSSFESKIDQIVDAMDNIQRLLINKNRNIGQTNN